MEDTEALHVGCAGQPLHNGNGTWKGHVYPGLVFTLWGLYWTCHTFQRRLRSQRTGHAFTTRAWYPCLLAGKWLYAWEPVLKILGGPIGMSIELYFDSPDGLKPLYCRETGRFAAAYAHNYQHAASYPGFFVSGLVDILGMYVQLPQGTEQIFLGLAFSIEGFLMVTHKKHMPLDAIAHQLLGYTMLAGALGVILELRAPGNFLVSLFRCFSVFMQGIWLISLGQMFFASSTMWSEDYTGPVMLVTPLFAVLLLLSAVSMLLLYLAMAAVHTRAQRYRALPTVAKSDALDETPHDSSQFDDFGLDDSANETSDDGSDQNDGHNDGQAKPKSTRSQLLSSLNLLKSGRQKPLAKPSEHIV